MSNALAINLFSSPTNPLIEKARRTARPARCCRICGCTDDNCARCVERTGHRCWWVGPGLCSACGATRDIDEINTCQRFLVHLRAWHLEAVVATYPADEMTQGYLIDTWLSVRRQDRYTQATGRFAITEMNVMRVAVACELLQEALAPC